MKRWEALASLSYLPARSDSFIFAAAPWSTSQNSLPTF
jgi:hypothetical protein